jgi:hypothetical protein
MAEIIKVRCNGPGKHVNDVDLDDALVEQPVARQAASLPPSVPERIVLRCHSCADGKVILTRWMIDQALKK